MPGIGGERNERTHVTPRRNTELSGARWPVMAIVLLVTSSYLLLVVRPGAPSSILASSSDASSP